MRLATECALNPLPVIVELKMPSGNWLLVPTAEMTGTVGLSSVTVAEATPPGPVALTVTVFDGGIVEGAVKSPADDTVPAVAVQLVARADMNC